MSRTKNYGNGLAHRLRSEKLLYQASESEIKADLKKIESAPSAKIIPETIIHEMPLPRKRVTSVEDFEYVIDGLVKLMTAKPKEKKKKNLTPEKKQIEPIQEFNPFLAMMPYFSMQSPMLLSDPMMLASQFNYISYPYHSVQMISSADHHLKLAKYIQSQKLNSP